MSTIVKIAILASLLALASSNGLAQQHDHDHDHGTEQDSIGSMRARTVEVEAEQARVSPAPQRTEVVSSRELRRAACCSLAESFERSPSVEVNYADAVSGARQIQMLGLSGLYTDVLVEATPIFRGIEIPFGFDHIPGPFMESISIAKGAGSVVSGYEGQTGQINVCVHDPFKTPAFFVNGYANSMDRFELNLYGAQNLSDELATTTMLHGRIRKGNIDNNGDNFQDSPEYDQLNVVHRWRYNDDKVELQAYANGVLDNYQNGQIAASGGMPLFEINTNIKRLAGFIKFGLLNPFDSFDESGLSVVVNASTNQQNSLLGVRTLDAYQHTLNVRGIGSFTFSDDFKLVGGISFMYDDVREEMIDTTAARGFNQSFARIEKVPGLFAEATISPAKSVTIVAGSRVDAHNLYGTRFIPRIHVKWAVGSLTSIRASAGSGWRVPTVITENMSAFINSRSVMFEQSFLPEQSVNVGLSATHSLLIGERPLTLDAEVYHTQFSNRVVIDFDRSPRELWVGNLHGTSYSTHAMGQVLFSPVERLELLAAYRWVNVMVPLGGEDRFAPMISRDRMLFTATWDSEEREWTIDASAVYAGGGRLPSTLANPAQYQRSTEFPGYWRFNAQVTKRWDKLEVYVGSENLGGFIQNDPVIAADAPYSEYFDASLAWGPTSPRMAYLGIRWELPH
ncbi:MAG: TonB-dependent receptor [Bradyrhizobiaceae bacterium]|nr:TonB-dependent receptor [Bradyrhizobiaceae bacterium]